MAPLHPRRIVYLGTPAIAVPPLEALVANGFEVVLVVTRPDRRRGRGATLSPSAVKAAALDLGLEVSHSVDDALTVGADLGVVVAFGQIIRSHVLDSLAMVNLHFSLLPRWRGAAPVERAILAGDATTGVAVMEVAEGLDTGGVYASREVPIGPQETADDLRRSLVAVGSALLVEVLAEGLGVATPQEGLATYAEKIDPQELEIDWTRPADEIDRLVRVGGAWTMFRGRRLKIWRVSRGEDLGSVVVAAGDGSIGLLEVQPEGKARMSAPAWANGAKPTAGEFGR